MHWGGDRQVLSLQAWSQIQILNWRYFTLKSCQKLRIRQISQSDPKKQFALIRDALSGSGNRRLIYVHILMGCTCIHRGKGEGMTMGYWQLGLSWVGLSVADFGSPLLWPNCHGCFLLFALHWWVGKSWWSNNSVSESNDSLVSSANFPQSLLMPQGPLRFRITAFRKYSESHTHTCWTETAERLSPQPFIEPAPVPAHASTLIRANTELEQGQLVWT